MDVKQDGKLMLYLHASYNFILPRYTAADKSLARPGRKTGNVSIGMARISFGLLALQEKKKRLMTARVSMLLKSRASPDILPSLFTSRSG